MLVVSGEEINIKRSSGAGDDSGPEVRRCDTGTNTEYIGAPFAGGTGTVVVLVPIHRWYSNTAPYSTGTGCCDRPMVCTYLHARINLESPLKLR